MYIYCRPICVCVCVCVYKYACIICICMYVCMCIDELFAIPIRLFLSEKANKLTCLRKL